MPEVMDRTRTRLASMVLIAAWAGALTAHADDQPPAANRVQALEAKIQSGKHTAEDHNALLDELYRQDKPIRGLAAAEAALKTHSSHPRLAARIARAFFRGGLLDRASSMFDKAVAIERDAVATVTLARLLLSENRANDAADLVARALTHHPDDLELNYMAALLHGRANRHTKAASHYARCRAIQAKDSDYPVKLIRDRASGREDLHRAAGQRVLNHLVSDGSMSFILPSNLPLPTVEVHLNDHPPVRMLLDLGGSGILSINAALAAKMGLTVLSSNQIGDVTGEQSATTWTLVDRLSIGDCTLSNVVTQAYPFDDTLLPNIQGVVGAGLFASRRWTLDFEKSSMVLSESRREVPSALAQLRDIIDTRFVSGDQAVVVVTVEDQRVNAIIDIGTPTTCFSTPIVRGLRRRSEISERNIGGLSALVTSGLAVKIGRRTIKSPGAIALEFVGGQTSSQVGTQLGVILGWDLFKHVRKLGVDSQANQLIIDWLPPRRGNSTPPQTSP
jgi:tetratricopeptide (TPR) repeat protein